MAGQNETSLAHASAAPDGMALRGAAVTRRMQGLNCIGSMQRLANSSVLMSVSFLAVPFAHAGPSMWLVLHDYASTAHASASAEILVDGAALVHVGAGALAVLKTFIA